MDADLPEPPRQPDHRRLRPRITPAQMVPAQPVVRTYEDVPAGGTEAERQSRTGGAG